MSSNGSQGDALKDMMKDLHVIEDLDNEGISLFVQLLTK